MTLPTTTSTNGRSEVNGMSILNDFKHKMDRAGKVLKDTAEDSAKAVESTSKDTGKAIERTATDAVGKTQKAGEQVRGAAMDVPGEIRGLVNKARDEINGLKNQALSEIQSAGQKAVGDVRSVGKDVAGDLEHTVVDQLPKLLATALSGLASEAMKPGLKGAAALANSMGDEMDSLKAEDPELVKAINQCGFKLKIKANVELLLVYNSFYTRVREMAAILDRAGNEGIALRRRDLIGFVESMGPTTVALGGGAEISLGFDLGGSASLTAIPLKLFSRLADRGLKELGVPE